MFDSENMLVVNKLRVIGANEEVEITRGKTLEDTFEIKDEFQFYFEVQINTALGNWQAVIHGIGVGDGCNQRTPGVYINSATGFFYCFPNVFSLILADSNYFILFCDHVFSHVFSVSSLFCFVV